MREVPRRGTPAYDWWSQGATDEAGARDEGLTVDQREVRDVWVDMCRLWNRRSAEPVADTVATLAGIFWAGLPWRRRLRLVWRAWR